MSIVPPQPSLAELTTLRLGGPAAQVVTADDEAALVAAVVAADDREEPLLILGGGSNVVVGDDGFAGTVILVRSRGIKVAEGCGSAQVIAQAGEDWDSLVAAVVSDDYSGIECLSGIPGSVGATPIQNVGAYGQEVADVISRVRVYDRQQGQIRELLPGQCGFSYRDSVFKRRPDRYVVLAVAFRLERSGGSRPLRYPELARQLGVGVGDRTAVTDVRDAVLSLRRGKGMVLDPADHDTWSAGSFFTNPIVDAAVADALPDAAPRFPAGGGVKVSAAWLIDNAGFGRGFGEPGPVTLSHKHVLALTNRGGATTQDLLVLARRIRTGVHDTFGITLVPEPVFVNCEL
ncbi:MAG: UDP-N-acetylmuramate dehydrogenase [Candidatus Nanopelagicales bacterium]